MKKSFLRLSSVIMSLALLLTMTVMAFADGEGWLGTFVVEGGNATIKVYSTQQESETDEGTVADTAYARNSDTGEIDTSGSGQINFTVVPQSGYEVKSVTATSGTYKNIKGPSDTGKDNTYRITKITGNLTITVTVGIKETEPEEEGDTVITFTNDDVTVTGSSSGVSVSDKTVTISESGDYTLTGTCYDGYVEVAKNTTGVNLILDNLDLTSATYAPISCKGSTEVTITASEGTVNTLTDADRSEEKPKSCVNSGGNLTFTGSGTLNVNGNNKNGIKADGNIIIDTLTLNVNSKDNSIAADSVLTINSGNINAVSTAGDCIKSAPDNEEETDPLLFGTIIINGGSITLESTAGDGIQAGNGDDNLSSLTINDGVFNIRTNGGYQTKISDSDDGSYKGIKSDNSLVINGGSFDINSADDAVHSNGDITINNGSFSIKTGDDGIHADNTVTIKNGTINILSCYEGIEGYDITVDDGDIDIISSDDGINISGGNDQSGTSNPGFNDDKGMNRNFGPGGKPGGDNKGGTMGENNSAGTLTINGGNIFVDASGDGLDANGSIVMNDGYVLIYGPVSDGDSAIDYDGSFSVNGGTIFAIGSSGMAQTPSSDSQAILNFKLSRRQSTGSISIKDSDGNVIASADPDKTYSSVIYSSPEIKTGESYSLVSGNNVLATISGSTGNNGNNGRVSFFDNFLSFFRNIFESIIAFFKNIL